VNYLNKLRPVIRRWQATD